MSKYLANYTYLERTRHNKSGKETVWLWTKGFTTQPFDNPTWQMRQLGGDDKSLLCQASTTSSSWDEPEMSIKIPGQTYPWNL